MRFWKGQGPRGGGNQFRYAIMLKPIYKKGEIGFSGKSLGCLKIGKFLYVLVGEPQVWYGELPPKFNPYRNLQYGGTTFGFRGKNYWFADDTLIGWLLRLLR